MKEFMNIFWQAGMISSCFVLCKIVFFNWIATFPEIGPVPLSVAVKKCNTAYDNILLWGVITVIILFFNVRTVIEDIIKKK